MLFWKANQKSKANLSLLIHKRTSISPKTFIPSQGRVVVSSSCWLLHAPRVKEHFLTRFAEAERFCFGWDDLDRYLQFIKSHLNRSFGIWDEDCCGDWRWDLCRTTTNITWTYINSPNNHPSPLMQDAERPSFWWKERPPSTTPTYYASAGRMVMGLGALHRCGVAVGEDFGGELQFLKCYKSTPVWNRRRTHHRPWIWPRGARESCCKGLSMRL
jgi:hypothetical protein